MAERRVSTLNPKKLFNNNPFKVVLKPQTWQDRSVMQTSRQ